MTKLEHLSAVGQSVWLDFIRRGILDSGALADLVTDGLRGLTSNPTIFQKAIGGSEDYDEAIATYLREHPDTSTNELYEHLAIDDIRRAADALLPVFHGTGGSDGFVSLEVSPHLAHDTGGTVGEAHRLWGVVDRPNLMIKVPATEAGIPAIEQLIAAGTNVNATLMFSLSHYESVANAYIRGLERAANPTVPASVASFFVSRVDSKVDSALDKIGTPEALALRGKIAIANSKLAYQRYQELFSGDGFAALRSAGAKPQRVLWASTSTKNPEYRDVLYVEGLIGNNTVNTLPPATLDAFRHHGTVSGDAISSGVDEARAQMRALAAVGVDIDAVTDELQVEGVDAFATSFDDMMATIDEAAAKIRS